MKVAVTSQNFRTVTAHAGRTRRFLVFAADLDRAPVEIGRFDLPPEMSMHEFRGGAHPLDAVDILLTGGAGDGLIRKLGQRGVRVVVTGESDPATAVSELMQGRIKPPKPHSRDGGH